jgi:hypothetical protein
MAAAIAIPVVRDWLLGTNLQFGKVSWSGDGILVDCWIQGVRQSLQINGIIAGVTLGLWI